MNREDYIKEAVAQFETILREQSARAEKMKNAPPATDFAKLDKIIIGCCGGDGIGPIITAEARRVLEFLLKDAIASGRIELRDIEGLTIENRIACGKAIPDDVLAALKECNVILKGPTTTPKGGTGAKELESANVAMRRELDLFANIRPVSVPEQGIDWTFFRENTEGEYVLGSRGVEIPDELCCDFKVTTDAGTERICRAAYDFAVKNGKLSLIHILYNIFDTGKILGRPAGVTVSSTSGLAGIAYWINAHYRLSGSDAITKKDPIVAYVKEWVDEQYADGRQTVISSRELENLIQKYKKEHN